MCCDVDVWEIYLRKRQRLYVPDKTRVIYYIAVLEMKKHYRLGGIRALYFIEIKNMWLGSLTWEQAKCEHIV